MRLLDVAARMMGFGSIISKLLFIPTVGAPDDPNGDERIDLIPRNENVMRPGFKFLPSFEPVDKICFKDMLCDPPETLCFSIPYASHIKANNLDSLPAVMNSIESPESPLFSQDYVLYQALIAYPAHGRRQSALELNAPDTTADSSSSDVRSTMAKKLPT